MCVCAGGVCETSMVTAKALYVAYMKSCASAQITQINTEAGAVLAVPGAITSLGYFWITLCTIHDSLGREGHTCAEAVGEVSRAQRGQC